MGGWLLIEESDHSSLRAIDATHPLAQSFDRQHREIRGRIAQAKLFDPYLGCRVRSLLENAGLIEISNEGGTDIARGGEAEARLICATRQAFVERGILSPAEYTEVEAPLLDPSFSFITRTKFAAWGKRAS